MIKLTTISNFATSEDLLIFFQHLKWFAPEIFKGYISTSSENRERRKT